MLDVDARERVTRVEALLEGAEALADPVARDTAVELVQAVLDLYGEGLERIVALLSDRDDGLELGRELAADDLIAHLLLLHGLHPVPVEDRVRGALEEVRPYLESHGGGVELVGIDDGIARLRLEGSCHGCPSSTATLKLAIEEAVDAAAPDLAGIEAEGVLPEPAPALLQLEVMPAAAPGRRAWAHTKAIPELGDGETLPREVEGEPVLFLRLDGRLYAYRSACPGCAGSLDRATLAGVELTCAGCGRRFDVRRAGRGLGDPALHLDPLPLLVEAEGAVKIALGAGAAV